MSSNLFRYTKEMFALAFLKKMKVLQTKKSTWNLE